MFQHRRLEIEKQVAEVPWPEMAERPPKVSRASSQKGQRVTCFHASFFPFCPLYWLPLFLTFSQQLFTLFSPRKVLCSVEQRAQHRAWRGAVSGWTSPQRSGRKFLPEICVKKGQKESQNKEASKTTVSRLFPDFWTFSGAKLYTPPPPPPPISGHKAFFRGGGWGCIF